MIQAILLSNNQIIISQVYQIDAEPGAPNCRLIDPYLITLSEIKDTAFQLTPWLKDITEENSFMIDPSKIITMVDPLPDILERYKKIILIENDLDYDDILEENDEEVNQD
jgi:hypothetical protein